MVCSRGDWYRGRDNCGLCARIFNLESPDALQSEAGGSLRVFISLPVSDIHPAIHCDILLGRGAY